MIFPSPIFVLTFIWLVDLLSLSYKFNLIKLEHKFSLQFYTFLMKSCNIICIQQIQSKFKVNLS
jgi:hypothetical protein